jgi:Fe2+ or Zn2+ uptake regulation protein
MKRSSQREVILQILRRYTGHVTAKEIYQDARKTIPNISLATVYRNLRVLVSQRQIAEYSDSRFPSRYEINTGNHYHVRCVRCGRMNDLPLTVLTGVEDKIAESLPYEILGHHLEIIGICPECQYRSKLPGSR